MSEQLIPDREEHIKSTTDMLRNRTPEEKAASLARGIDMLVEDLPANREFYDRMKGLRALKAAGYREQSDNLHKYTRDLYGPLGYDTSIAEKNNP
jgi:hypothetical protein